MVRRSLYVQFTGLSTFIFDIFKGAAHQKKHIFSLDCYDELPCFGVIGCRDFGPLSNIMGLNGALNVVLTAQRKNTNILKDSTIMSLSRNHDPVTKIIHRLCCEQFSCQNPILTMRNT